MLLLCLITSIGCSDNQAIEERKSKAVDLANSYYDVRAVHV